MTKKHKCFIGCVLRILFRFMESANRQIRSWLNFANMALSNLVIKTRSWRRKSKYLCAMIVQWEWKYEYSVTLMWLLIFFIHFKLNHFGNITRESKRNSNIFLFLFFSFLRKSLLKFVALDNSHHKMHLFLIKWTMQDPHKRPEFAEIVDELKLILAPKTNEP